MPSPPTNNYCSRCGARIGCDCMTLAYRRKPVVFFTLAGVKTVDLVECDKIRGAWWPYARRFVINDEAKPARFANASSKLLENFANWPCTPEDVLRFTKNYGPLTSTAVGNETFSFSVNDWRSSQKEFQQGWKQLMQKSRSVVSKLLGPPLSPEDVEEFFFSGTGLEYRTATLYRLLCVELFSIPKDKLRKCA